MNKIKNIVRSARGDKSQVEFASTLGKSQGVLSKYEKGVVSPPTEVLERCLDILQMNNTEADIKCDELARRVSSELRASKFLHVRKTIEHILNNVTP